MRVYWRASLFLYSVDDSNSNTPIINFWRATVYTWGTPAKKKTLKRAIEDVLDDAEADLIETTVDPYGIAKKSWEKRQVAEIPSSAHGFNAVDISHGWRKRGDLHPEERMELFQLQIYEASNARLGLSDAGKFFYKARKVYRVSWRTALERGYKRIWAWLAS